MLKQDSSSVPGNSYQELIKKIDILKRRNSEEYFNNLELFIKNLRESLTHSYLENKAIYYSAVVAMLGLGVVSRIPYFDSEVTKNILGTISTLSFAGLCARMKALNNRKEMEVAISRTDYNYV